MMSRLLAMMLPCVTMTPLGSPVEPEVHMMAARSRRGSTASGGGSGAADRQGLGRPDQQTDAQLAGRRLQLRQQRAETTMRRASVPATMRCSICSLSATGSGTAHSPARMAPR